jgi:hypothetical protein
MHDKQMAAPDNTAVRTALWRALHVQVDLPPHVFEDEIGSRSTPILELGAACMSMARSSVLELPRQCVNSKVSGRGAQLVKFLTGPTAMPVFKTHSMEPAS